MRLSRTAFYYGFSKATPNMLNAGRWHVLSRRQAQCEEWAWGRAHRLSPCQLNESIEGIISCAQRGSRGKSGAAPGPQPPVVVEKPGGPAS